MTGQQRLKNYHSQSGGKRTASYILPRGKKIYLVTPAQRKRLVQKHGMGKANA